MSENKFYHIGNIIPHLKHPEKCKSKTVTCRSGWEISFIIKYLDVNPNIIEWRSEDVVVKYISPIDNEYHRYFIDFEIKAKTSSGSVKTIWIEIKPHQQTLPPKVPKRKSKHYLESVKTYYVNSAKWETTRKVVNEKKQQGHDIDFQILTEKDCPFFL